MTKNERFAYDSYRRFIQMFGDVVMGIEQHGLRADHRAAQKHAKQREAGHRAERRGLKALVALYKAGRSRRRPARSSRRTPRSSCKYAINAVFGSWDNQRAVTYRR